MEVSTYSTLIKTDYMPDKQVKDIGNVYVQVHFISKGKLQPVVPTGWDRPYIEKYFSNNVTGKIIRFPVSKWFNLIKFDWSVICPGSWQGPHLVGNHMINLEEYLRRCLVSHLMVSISHCWCERYLSEQRSYPNEQPSGSTSSDLVGILFVQS